MATVTSHDNPVAAFKTSCGGEVAGDVAGGIDDPETAIAE